MMPAQFGCAVRRKRSQVRMVGGARDPKTGPARGGGRRKAVNVVVLDAEISLKPIYSNGATAT